MKFCCAMRNHFLIGIVGTSEGDAPIETADFVLQWEPHIVLRIAYCPFCGKKIEDDETVRVMRGGDAD